MDYSHDRNYKHLLSYRKIFQEVIEQYIEGEWKQELDLEKAEKMDKSFILQDFAERESDIIYRVPFKQKEKEVYLYILIEHQSSVDFTMPFRFLVYITELWRDIFKNTEENKRKSKGFRLPPVFPILLYNGEHKWTAFQKLSEIIEGSHLFPGFIPDFSYYLLDISHYPEDKLKNLAGNLAKIFLLEHPLSEEKIFSSILECFRGLEQESDKEIWKAISNWLAYFMKKCFQTPQIEEILSEIQYEKRKESFTMIETLGERLINYWKKEGLKEGLKEGIKEGKQETLKKSICRVVKKRFGNMPQSIQEKLEKMQEIAELESILDKSLDASSPDEIFP